MFKITLSLDMLSDFTDSEIEAIFQNPSDMEGLDDFIIDTRATRTIRGWVYEFDISGFEMDAALFAAQSNAIMWKYVADGVEQILEARKVVDDTPAIVAMLNAENARNRKRVGGDQDYEAGINSMSESDYLDYLGGVQ